MKAHISNKIGWDFSSGAIPYHVRFLDTLKNQKEQKIEKKGDAYRLQSMELNNVNNEPYQRPLMEMAILRFQVHQ